MNPPEFIPRCPHEISSHLPQYKGMYNLAGGGVGWEDGVSGGGGVGWGTSIESGVIITICVVIIIYTCPDFA